MRLPRILALAAHALLLGASARSAGAQRQRRLFVHVLSDSGAAIADADIVVFAPSVRSIGQSRSDAAGRAVIRLPSELPSNVTVTARHLGYAAASRQINVSRADSSFLELRLATATRMLPGVSVDVARMRPERRPYIDSTEIASSTRSILSLADVVKKLRWNIDYQVYKCLPRTAVGPAARGPIPGTPHDELHAEVYVNGQWIPPEWDPGHLIHSEHIAEMRYVNCFDHSVQDLPELPWAALYVTLKPGVAWDVKRGSYLLDEASSEHRPARDIVTRSATPARSMDRLLGVYDEESGAALADVSVTDSASGTTALTTATGTISLGFVSNPTASLRIHKLGYVDQVISVRMSEPDTLPITLVLKRAPAVVR